MKHLHDPRQHPYQQVLQQLAPLKAQRHRSTVFHIIDASEVELRPAEIARKLHAPKKPTRGQYTSVRVFCRKLLDKGLIIQPYQGAYCNKITYGVRFVPLAVHNISLRSFVCQDVKSWEKNEFIGGVKIHVCLARSAEKSAGISLVTSAACRMMRAFWH